MLSAELCSVWTCQSVTVTGYLIFMSFTIICLKWVQLHRFIKPDLFIVTHYKHRWLDVLGMAKGWKDSLIWIFYVVFVIHRLPCFVLVIIMNVVESKPCVAGVYVPLRSTLARAPFSLQATFVLSTRNLTTHVTFETTRGNPAVRSEGHGAAWHLLLWSPYDVLKDSLKCLSLLWTIPPFHLRTAAVLAGMTPPTHFPWARSGWARRLSFCASL